MAAATIVDTHHHLCPPSYLEMIKRKQGLNPYVEQVLRRGSPEKSLEDMDRAGVTHSIMSLTTPGVWFGDVAEGRKIAREVNEHFAKIVADHPGRYGVFAAIPLPDVEGSLKEIEYALDTLKADGIGLFTSYNEKHLGDAAFAPVFAELNRRKAVVYTHPLRPDCCAALVPEVSEAVIEYGTDTTRTIASLAFSGTAARCPDIRFLFSHAGGTMPFLIERFTNLAKSGRFAQQLPEGFLGEARKFYYDTAQSSNPAAMSALTKVIPVSQIVFGTDFPFRTASEHVTGLKECGMFSPKDLERIDRENLVKLLPRYSI
jgi:predicted TIM-barrel fold metal-dependent hydrolase